MVKLVLAGGVAAMVMAGCTGVPVVPGRWTALPSTAAGSATTWTDWPSATAGRYLLRSENGSGTLFLILEARDGRAAMELGGTGGGKLTLWIDPSNGKSKEEAVEVLPGDRDATPQGLVHPNVQLLISAGGIFGAIPPPPGLEVIRDLAGSSPRLAFTIPYSVINLRGVARLEIGIEATPPEAARAHRRERDVAGSEGVSSAGAPPGFSGRRGRGRRGPRQDAGDAPASDPQWCAVALATDPALMPTPP